VEEKGERAQNEHFFFLSFAVCFGFRISDFGFETGEGSGGERGGAAGVVLVAFVCRGRLCKGAM
jgi:hypothetical protein